MGFLGFFMCLVEIYEIVRQRTIHPFKHFSVSHAVIQGVAQLIIVVGFISTGLILLVDISKNSNSLLEFYWVFLSTDFHIIRKAQKHFFFSGKWINPYIVGYAVLSLQFCSLYTTLTMSLNRAVSVAIPTAYSTIFTRKNTIIIIGGTWIFSFTSCFVFLIGECASAYLRT